MDRGLFSKKRKAFMAVLLVFSLFREEILCPGEGIPVG